MEKDLGIVLQDRLIKVLSHFQKKHPNKISLQQVVGILEGIKTDIELSSRNAHDKRAIDRVKRVLQDPEIIELMRKMSEEVL